VLEKSEDELLALRNFGRKSYDELRDKLIELGFLQEGVEGMGGGGTAVAEAPPRTIMPGTTGEDEELGPVAKALLEALKESGREDLIAEDETDDDEEA
jgi:hypothetical protein